MIAFGPSAAMLGITIAKDPIRIIILISAYVLVIIVAGQIMLCYTMNSIYNLFKGFLILV